MLKIAALSISAMIFTVLAEVGTLLGFFSLQTFMILLASALFLSLGSMALIVRFELKRQPVRF